MRSATPTVNPFFAARRRRLMPRPDVAKQARYARLPKAPVTGSPVPHLTSLYHFDRAGEYGDRSYPGNCGGNLIKDLLTFFRPVSVFDPMTGSMACSRISCSVLGSTLFNCRSNEARLRASAYSARILVLIGTRANGDAARCSFAGVALVPWTKSRSSFGSTSGTCGGGFSPSVSGRRSAIAPPPLLHHRRAVDAALGCFGQNLPENVIDLLGCFAGTRSHIPDDCPLPWRIGVNLAQNHGLGRERQIQC
jgi:hypothetical protein